jgi:argininosuccinate lyase
MTDAGYSLSFRTPPLVLPDFFASMADMNKASLVALRETGVVPAELAARIGRAVRELIEREDRPGARRSQDYLDFERDLIAAVGPEASWLHVGRSRQDMMSTGVSLWLRAAYFVAFEDLLQARAAVLRLAAKHEATVIPTYTHGVQAQPTSAAHYLLAIDAGLERSTWRLVEGFARANRSPLGAGAGTTSSFPIDRERLAALLGFDGIVDNAFDANLVAPIDATLEFVGALATLAVQIAQLTQDLHAQFYLAEPWLVLDPSSMLTGISSMMPQKRNPRVLELVREHASVVIGSSQSMVLLAHNTHSGMTDVRESVTAVVPISRTHELLVLLARTLDALVIDPRRSLAEVNRDYSTMTNLAEHLVQAAGVPFRTAHEFASALTDHGRRHGLTPPQIAYAEAAAIYRACTSEALPLSEAEFARAIDPVHVVATRRGRGGPQPDELERMLSSADRALGQHRAWLDRKKSAAVEAKAALEAAFAGVLSEPAQPRVRSNSARSSASSG